MNIVFHLAAGVSIIAGASQLDIGKKTTRTTLIASGFILGILSHGILDYAPHCYPINSKADAICGLILILLGTLTVKKQWRLIVFFTLIGCVFPDLVDHTPEILNSYLGTKIPSLTNIFPWHLEQYSGSIFTNSCDVSTINHILVLLFCMIILLLNRQSLPNILR